ncbi:hypothetical protein [Streptomyces sp. NPDC004528]|uniref:hypothetical protein n=1 Tax=Streptomyces sp. NPDC004528 TaxID=3154550 RepID=UPI0033A3993C
MIKAGPLSMFESIAELAPAVARVQYSHTHNSYWVYFARTRPDGSALSQGRLNVGRRKVEYTGSSWDHAPLLELTRDEARSLSAKLAEHFVGLNSAGVEKLRKELKDAQDEVSRLKVEHDKRKNETRDAVYVNRLIREEASGHKNKARDLQSRLDQMTALYNGLLDRLAAK